MFVNKLKMDEIAEAVKKCMDEADLEETGLRKAAYAAHTKGEKMFSFKGKTYPVKVQGEEVSYGKEIKEASCEDEVKKHEKRLHGKDGEVSKHVDKMHKEELSHKQKKIAKLNHPKDEIDAGDLAKLRGEETELDEADKVATPTGMRVYGSSYGDSAKARRDQLKRPVDDTKGPNKSQLAQMAKIKKEEFFKDKLISNYIEEEAAFEAELQEVLSKDASAGDYISDFVHSDNPKFAGKSVKKRQKMALAAYYAKKRNESVDDSYPVTTDTVAGRMPGGMSNTFKQFKVRVSAKDKEAAETKNRIPNSDPMNMTAREPHVGHGGLVSIPPAGIVRKEEVEQLDELSPGALKAYVNKAKPEVRAAKDVRDSARHGGDGKTANDMYQLVKKRTAGIKQAKAKLNAEEVEELDEISLDTMKSAKEKLGNKAFQAHMDDNKHGAQHYAGRAMDMKKKIAQKERQVTKEEVELDEATPPKNTDIADKSYLKDMGKKPTVKSDLKNFKNFLTGKKETNEGKQPETDNVPFVTNADQPPFDGPYKKIDKVTTDKSGAKHTPMSRARDLAQAAMKRVKTEMLGKAPGNNG
jgi:hypothetical protein